MPKRTKGLFLIIGALLVLLSVLLQSWCVHVEERVTVVTVRVGLTKMTMTEVSRSGRTETESAALSEGRTQEEEGTWVLFGTLAWWLGLLAALGLAGAGVMQFTSADVAFPLDTIVMLACAGALTCGVLYMFVLLPEGLAQGFDMSWGFWAYLLGTGAGIATRLVRAGSSDDGFVVRP